MTRIDEQYTIMAENADEHNKNREFLQARFPIGNTLGFLWDVNDDTFTIVLKRLNWDWVPPTP